MSDSSWSHGGSPQVDQFKSSQSSPSAAQSKGDPSLVGKAAELGRGLMDQAVETTDQLKNQAQQLMASTKDKAVDAKDKIADTVSESLNDHKATGADYVGGIARSVRNAADGFDSNVPQAAEYIRLAAEQIDGLSSALRKQDFNELIGGVQDFARRQPTAFLGVAAVAGFALVRFLKSTGGGHSASAGQRSATNAPAAEPIRTRTENGSFQSLQRQSELGEHGS